MNYFITGISGFVGAHLAQRLFDDGHNVYALNRSSAGREADILDVVSADCFNSIKFCYGDLLDINGLKDIFSQTEFQGCFHLAAQSHPPTGFLDPIGTLNTNLIGSANLFRAIELTQGLGCKICVVSTSEVYGNSGSDGRLLKETDQLSPSNPYAAGKAAMELYFQERCVNKKNTGFVTRAFSHTGKRRGKTFSISSDAYQIAGFINHFNKNKFDPMYNLRVGNLETIRVVISVNDVVDAYVKLMYSGCSSGEVFNVCGDTPRKMQYFSDKLIEMSGLNIEKVIDDNLYRPFDIAYQHGDSTKLKQLTGWAATENIDNTLNDLLRYWIKKQSK